MNADLFDLAEALSSAPNAGAGFAAVAAALRQYDVSDFSYGALSQTGQAHRPLRIELYHITFSEAIAAQMGGVARYENDLTSARAAAGMDSDWTDTALWDCATPAQLAQSEHEIAMGYYSGYTHVLGRSGGLTMAVGLSMQHLTGAAFSRHWPELSQSVLPIARLMEARFGGAQRAQFYNLTARELDVLTWLAMGLRPEEIAQRLNIGYRTVDKYIVSARGKLGARTRDHAVARALVLGLILR